MVLFFEPLRHEGNEDNFLMHLNFLMVLFFEP